MYHVNIKHKKSLSGYANMWQNKFLNKINNTRDKEEDFIKWKKVTYYENIIIFNTYATDNRFSKCMKQKPTEFKEKNNNSTVIVGDNTPFSIIDKRSIRK